MEDPHLLTPGVGASGRNRVYPSCGKLLNNLNDIDVVRGLS